MTLGWHMCVYQLSRDLGEAQGHQKKHNAFHHSVVLSFKGKTLNMVK